MQMKNKFLGSTDLAPILGLSRYKTPFDVWQSKTQDLGPSENNEFTEAGNILEPVILEYFRNKTGAIISNEQKKYLHPEFNFLIS